MRIIAVVNQKGGVGKTTTSVNLGAALALRGRRVLLVDMDPQGNLTDHLLGDVIPDPGRPPGAERRSVYDVLVDGAAVADCVVAASTPGLSVLPSHEDMAGAELDLAAVIGREVILRDALADVPSDAYDFVFLDCPPSLGLLSLNALAAANEVFIALQTEFFAMRGLSALDRTIDLVRRRINPGLSLGGIVATLVDPTRLSREVMEEVRGHYGDRVFQTRVRTNIRLAEAPSHGLHIFDYAPDSPGAADYAALADEVLAGIGARGATAAGTSSPGASGARATEPDRSATAATASASAPTSCSQEGGKFSARRGIARAIAEAAAAVTTVASPAPAPERRPASTPASSPALTTPMAASAATAVDALVEAPEATAAMDVIAAARPSATAAPSLTTPVHQPELAPVAAASARDVAAIVVPVASAPSIAAASAPAALAETTLPRAAVAAASAPAGRRVPIALPVVRAGPRPLSIAPMPTRSPSALPRPAVAVAASGTGAA